VLVPALDVWETKSEITTQFDLRGLAEGEISIEVADYHADGTGERRRRAGAGRPRPRGLRAASGLPGGVATAG
jgi:hypothetical protein